MKKSKKRKRSHKDPMMAGLKSLAKQAKAEEQAQQLTPDRRKLQRRRISNLLQEAERLVYEVRNKSYKHPMQNFTNIAQLWNCYTHAHGRDSSLVSNLDVAALNILQKIARISTNQHHEDSWLDVAGYAACAERILKNK